MSESDAILIPDDEFLARPHLVAWLAYPFNVNRREKSRIAAIDWARAKAGERAAIRSDRLENALRAMDKEINRQLLAGAYFERNLLDLESNKYGIRPLGVEGHTAFSQSALGRRSERLLHSPMRGDILRFERSNAQKILWRFRLPCLALAIGANRCWRGPQVCRGSSLADIRAAHMRRPRPDLEHLLFTDEPWAVDAIRIAKEFRRRAFDLAHPDAASLLQFEVVTFLHRSEPIA